MILLGILAFLIGSTLFIGSAVLWYYMAKWEYRQPFHALCPEMLQPVDIYVDGTHAARTRFDGHEELIVTSCSRWPERRGCDQGCTPQIPLLGDSRVDRKIAVFGTQPNWLKSNTPVHMTKDVYDKVMAQTRHAS
ncbi:MAG: hypothetical protein ACXVZV_04275 [Terriglobales bacterium]